MSEFTMAFWIIMTGALAAASCGLLGSFLVLRKMSLIGDAISHSVLPGIAIAFLLSGSRSTLPMILGASAFGLLTAVLIETLNRRWRVQEDASIGIVFTALFALGVVLISLYAGHIDLDQECVLYGEIAYTPFDLLSWGDLSLGPRPVWLLGIVFFIDLLFVLLFYKELLISSFDPGMAISIGINATLIHYALMAAVSMTTVAAFESVGAILVVAMLIVPGATAYLLTDNLKTMLWLSVLVGVISSTAGYFVAVVWDSSIAAVMTVISGLLFMSAFIFSPRHGLASKAFNHFLLSINVIVDHILLSLYRISEKKAAALMTRAQLFRETEEGALRAVLAWFTLKRKKYIQANTQQQYFLTPEGMKQAASLVRRHRLWETFLDESGLPSDHVHEPANRMEHFIKEDLETKLIQTVGEKQSDPHGKPIPEAQ
ncbi:MAG: iron chelate uptake ABC transporter family permease subunit [Candidatus Zhuqueibacterota bacterium]